MKKALCVCLLLGLFVAATRASAQAYGQVSEQETLNNDVLSIELTCTAFGSWDYLDDGTEAYVGVSIGGADLHGCQLNDPNGQSSYQDSAVQADNDIRLQVYLPVTQSGTWQYFSSFWIWLEPCNADEFDCEDYPDFPYQDPWGYAYDGANSPAFCELNGSECEGPYNGQTLLADFDGLEYGYSGESSSTVGTFM